MRYRITKMNVAQGIVVVQCSLKENYIRLDNSEQVYGSKFMFFYAESILSKLFHVLI